MSNLSTSPNRHVFILFLIEPSRNFTVHAPSSESALLSQRRTRSLTWALSESLTIKPRAYVCVYSFECVFVLLSSYECLCCHLLFSTLVYRRVCYTLVCVRYKTNDWYWLSESAAVIGSSRTRKGTPSKHVKPRSTASNRSKSVSPSLTSLRPQADLEKISRNL